MRLQVSLNNEQGFSAHQPQPQYCHNPYGSNPCSPYQGEENHQQEYYSTSSSAVPTEQYLQQIPAAVSHVVPPTEQQMQHYSSSSSMQATPPQQHYISASNNNQSHPSLPSHGTLSASSQSFYGGSSDSDEVQSLNSQHGGSSVHTQPQSVSSYCSAAPVPVGGKPIRPMGTHAAQRGHVDPSRFKTEPCSYHVQGEICPFTPNCAFAHGDSEKRSRRRNVREGVTKVNTLPRTLVYHEAWVQTTKYTRKTGPGASTKGAAGFIPSNAAPTSVPAPSFKKA